MAWPLHLLQRHPFSVKAHFANSLVLTYALPAELLAGMIPDGLRVDTFNGLGFVAIAMVQTENLRPTVFPRAMGQTFFLVGYRIFTTFKPTAARTLRGLYILRSDTDRRLMATAGNLLTHYQYRVSQVETERHDGLLRCRITTRGGKADLDVTATIDGPGDLPAETPFHTLQEARRFAGPLPYTFDEEPQTRSIIAIKAVRTGWNPRVVPVTVHRVTFFDQPPFAGTTPRLASAFYVENIDYQWNRGVRYALDRVGATA